MRSSQLLYVDIAYYATFILMLRTYLIDLAGCCINIFDFAIFRIVQVTYLTYLGHIIENGNISSVGT